MKHDCWVMAALVICAGFSSFEAGAAEPAVEIATGFERLGMSQARAVCFGRVIVNDLSPDAHAEAVRIVADAETPDDINMGVIRAGGGMVGAFTVADASCRGGQPRRTADRSDTASPSRD